MQTINLALEHVNGNEIIIREGKAIEIKPPEKIEISGDIRTVKSFIDKRKKLNPAVDPQGLAGLQGINPDRAVVTVDKSDLSITLELDPEYFYGAVVEGKLEMEPELLKFNINNGGKFTQQELIKLLRFNKRFFADTAAHETLLKSYMALDVKVTADLKNNAPDNRGNRSNSFEKKITSNIPEDFILLIPIFKGQEPKKFRVEIILDSTDGSTRFWLESVELAELVQIESERILNEQLKSCEDYVVIWK